MRAASLDRNPGTTEQSLGKVGAREARRVGLTAEGIVANGEATADA